MTQKAAAKTTTSDGTPKNARRLFFVGLLDLSWRLAVAIIVPVVAGSFIDNSLETGSLFTILGVFVGVGLSAWVIRSIVVKLNKETSK